MKIDVISNVLLLKPETVGFIVSAKTNFESVIYHKCNELFQYKVLTKIHTFLPLCLNFSIS